MNLALFGERLVAQISHKSAFKSPKTKKTEKLPLLSIESPKPLKKG
jgi:hypothetical protein